MHRFVSRGRAARLVVPLAIAATLVSGCPSAEAEDPETSSRVLRLFAQSNIYPERFDGYIAEGNGPDEATLDCVRALGTRFRRIAANHLVHCYTIHDPFERGRCKANNPAAIIASWCDGLLAHHEGTPWCETDYGRVSCESKASGDPTRYEQLNQALLGMVQPLLVCR
jgi:hypothetical protein